MSDDTLCPATVAHDVRAAFADAALSVEPSEDTGGIEALLAAHGGPPTLQFLERLVGRASVARPPAEAWFWRSLLLAAIEIVQDPEHRAMTLYPTVRALMPEPIVMVHGWTDYGPEAALAIRERFTPAQRVAVARFLRLIIEASPATARSGSPHLAQKSSLAYSASQAIVWCWRDDPSSLCAAEALRLEARSYQRLPADDVYNEFVIVAVERAFADTPPPVGWPMGCLDEEGSSYAIEFKGADWRTLAPWFVDCHSSAFSFMTDAAFRYFLPAALCHNLGPGSMVEPEFHLVNCVVDESSFRDSSRARILLFTHEERAAVCDFLHNSFQWSWRPEAYEVAVRDFWDPVTGLQELTQTP